MRQGRTYLKKDDQVEVIAGKDKGKIGKILEVNKWSDLVNVNMIDHVKNNLLLPYLNNQLWFNVGKRKIEFPISG